MSYQNENEIIPTGAADVELKKLREQFDTVIAALEDVLTVFRSGASDEIKLIRIEDLLSSAVSDAANIS